MNRFHRRSAYVSAVILVIVLLVARQVVFLKYVMPSEKMLPTIRPGDIVIINRWSYRLHSPARGDIALFSVVLPRPFGTSTKPSHSISRIMGLPGDVIEVRGGVLRRNGSPLNEPYVLEPGQYQYMLKPCKVPEGRLFVLGDNRDNSFDSSYYGPVKVDQVVGKVWIHLRLGSAQGKCKS